MMRKIHAGSTSQAIPIFVQDSTSTSGAGLGSLAYNTAGLAAKYRRQGDATWTTITLATATVGTYTSGGFVADGGPVTGGYEFGIPDAALADTAGVTWAEVAIYGAASMVPVLIFIELDQVDYQDAQRAGLAAMPSTGTLAVKPAVTLASTDVTGNVAADVQTIKTQAVTCAAGVTVNTNLGTTQPVNFTGTAGSALVKSDTVDIAGSAVSTSTAQIGVNLVNIKGTASAGAAGSVGIDWGQVANPTTSVALSGTTISTSQAVASVGGSVGSVTGNVGGSVASVTGNVGGSVVGDVEGKVLGGGASAITGVGADVNTTQFLGQAVVLDANNYPGVNIVDVAGSTASTYTGTAQAGTANTITLAAGETTNPLGREIALVGGTGAGQSAACTAYNGTTKVATVYCPQGTGGNWATNPDATTQYAINDIVPTVDSSGRVLLQPTQAGVTIPTVTAITNAVTLTTSQVLGSPRDVSAVADGSITLNDALWGAVAGPFGKESISGTTYTVQTPSTGTTLRSFTLDSSSAPTSRT